MLQISKARQSYGRGSGGGGGGSTGSGSEEDLFGVRGLTGQDI